MSDSYAKGVQWDLSDLYAGLDDPKILADLKKVEERALSFEKKYKPLMASLNKDGVSALLSLLKDYEEMLVLMTKLGVFSQLSFAEKTDDPARGAFMQKIETALTDSQSHTLFFEVAWNKLGAAKALEIQNDARLKDRRHFLEKLRSWAPHTLSEGEEKIMALKNMTSSSAFQRLFDEVINGIIFSIEIDGKTVKKTEGEILSLLHSPEQNLRQKASESLSAGLKDNTRIITYIYNMILADHRVSLKIRNFKHPMDSRNLSNEMALEGVERLIKSVKKAYPILQRYYRLKKKLLRLDTLHDYDRYAPISASDKKINFKECQKIVLDGYFAFDKEVGKMIEPFFAKRWIDAEVREGKQGGGFCCSTTPDLHPYILVNYTGSLRDVMTVAHELGHGLHQTLAAKAGILESNAPLTMAETASVFGEMLIFEKILSDEKNPEEKLALICGKIDDNFATVFRQIILTDFELKAHEAGLQKGELGAEVLSDFWMKANAESYGNSVKLTPNYRHGWKYIPHFVHTPFYCYAYSFAQLFVLSLYQKYKEDKKGFVPTYLEMLSLGGSKKPDDIALLAGLNLKDPKFWDLGIELLDHLVQEAESIV